MECLSHQNPAMVKSLHFPRNVKETIRPQKILLRYRWNLKRDRESGGIRIFAGVKVAQILSEEDKAFSPQRNDIFESQNEREEAKQKSKESVRNSIHVTSLLRLKTAQVPWDMGDPNCLSLFTTIHPTTRCRYFGRRTSTVKIGVPF